MPDISVILCTHNPQIEILQRTLASLQAQTLDQQRWELLVIDNASTPSLAGRLDARGHPAMRVIREERLGHTSARVCGIELAAAPLIVFIDDDNVFAPDYLATALRISTEYPFLGAWGGAVTGEFEIAPPDWAQPYLGWLALRNPERISWSNATVITESMPCGAGLCVRRDVAAAWAEHVRSDPRRLALGRIGAGLGASDDADLAFTACDRGLGNGVFPELRVLHLIPARRLSLEYFERLVEDMSRTEVLLRSLRHQVHPYRAPSLSARLFHAYSRLRMPPPVRRLLRASERGYRAGVEAACASPNPLRR